MKKRRILVVAMLMIAAIITVVALTVKGQEVETEEQIRAVTVQEIQSSERPVQLNYVGTLDAKEIIKYSFKTDGQIGRKFVEKGARVKKGDKLLELDKHDLEFQVSSARTAMESARLSIMKAEDSINYIQANFDRMSSLYAENVIAKDQYEQLKLELDNAQSSLLQAQSQYAAATTNYEYQLSLERDATIYAEQDGMVVELMSEEKERVSAFTPVISVRSVEEVVNIGIPQQDLEKIKVGAKAAIDMDGQKAEGVVGNIAEAPDTATRTYKAEVTVQGKDLKASVKISKSILAQY